MANNFFPENQTIQELNENLASTIKELRSNPYSIPEDSERLLDITLFDELSYQHKKGKPTTLEEHLRLHRWMHIWKIALIRCVKDKLQEEGLFNLFYCTR